MNRELMGKSVNWTHYSSGRKSVSLSRKEGVVESIDGNMATIKLASGKRVLVEVVRLKLPGETSQITEFVEAVRDAAKKE